jgi:hypothetical protein
MSQSVVQKPSEPQMLRRCFCGYVFSIPRNSIHMTASYVKKKQILTILRKAKEKLKLLYGIKPNKMAQRI